MFTAAGARRSTSAAVSSGGAAWRNTAAAQVRLAMSWAVRWCTLLVACTATATHRRGGYAPKTAKAQARLTNPCGLKLEIRSAACSATRARSSSPGEISSFASAHIVLLSPCCENSGRQLAVRGSMRATKRRSAGLGGWPARRVAKAHTVLARFWGLKSGSFSAAALASCAWKSSERCPSLAKAQIRLAISWGLKELSCWAEWCATASSTTAPGWCPTRAYAQAVLARFCGLKRCILRRASPATACISAGCCSPKCASVAKAHSVLAIPCGLKSRSLRCASAATARISCRGLWFRRAKAQIVLDRSCELNSGMRSHACASIASRSGRARRPSVASAHAELESCCGEKPRILSSAQASRSARRGSAQTARLSGGRGETLARRCRAVARFTSLNVSTWSSIVRRICRQSRASFMR